MIIKGFYHICMVNDWQGIVKEQIQLLTRSGLYDRMQTLSVGCVGKAEDLNRLKKIVEPFCKIQIKVYSGNVKDYEFITLSHLWEKSCKTNNFFGFYIHTKGVSYPNHEGGKYWRDYMNYFNITRWKECYKKLIDGYDTCGVKYLTAKQAPALRAHYSGNFYWFKSTYTKTLPDPLKMNLSDRFEAEMWIGLKAPEAASLCQMFVDYNTKGKFTVPIQIQKQMKKIIVHTLCWNLPSEVEKSTNLLYSQNPNTQFKHYICDLGFPLIVGDEIPKSIEKSIAINTEKLKDICRKYGSTYIRLQNIGVSQNWTQIINHCQLEDEDVIIGLDPDERPVNNGWVNAMSLALEQDKIGMVSLMMPIQAESLRNWQHYDRVVSGIRMTEVIGSVNWALIGFNGKFTKAMGVVPFPSTHPRYGYIEHFTREALKQLGYKYLFLPDHQVIHTDYELGNSEGASRLLREWKNFIIFGDIHQRSNPQKVKEYGQITLERFLELRTKGIL